MNLFIIGNGFDIAHGLPTKYDNFREYLDQEYWDFLIALEEQYNYRPESKIELVKNRLWKEFEKNLVSINETEIIEWGSSIDMGLEGGDYDVLDHLEEYFHEHVINMADLNNYLKSWIENIDIKTTPKTDKIFGGSDDLFLNFNYTLLLEEIYGIESENILHIHGSIDVNEEFPPVIGHGDTAKISGVKELAAEASEYSDDKQEAICNVLVRFYEDSLKNVNYYLRTQSYFFKKLNEVEEVTVIGHSFGDVDLPYFKEVLQNIRNDAVWKIYYHEKEEEAIFKNKIISVGVSSDRINCLHTTDFYYL